MLYLLALIVPPLAVLLSGKPFQFLVSLGLFVCGIVFPPLLVAAVLHALFVVANAYADRRTDRLVRAMREQPRG